MGGVNIYSKKFLAVETQKMNKWSSDIHLDCNIPAFFLFGGGERENWRQESMSSVEKHPKAHLRILSLNPDSLRSITWVATPVHAHISGEIGR